MKQILLLSLLLASAVHAQIPAHLNHQGRVAVQGTNFHGTGQFKFALVDAGANVNQTATATGVATLMVTSVSITSGGSGYTDAPAVTIAPPDDPQGSQATATATISGGVVTEINIIEGGSGYFNNPVQVTIAPPPENIEHQIYWSNAGDLPPNEVPGTSVSLSVDKGLYSVRLGDTSVTNMAPFNPDIFYTPLFLRVWFSDGVNGFQQLTPDQPLGAAPYSMLARTVTAGAITAAALAPGSVTATALAPGTVAAALPSQAMLLSASENDPALTSLGYIHVGQTQTTPSWRALPVAGVPSPRAGHTAVWTGAELIIWGGYSSSAVVNTGARYNPANNTWTPMSTNNAPSARENHAAVWTGTEMIVWGGSFPATGGGRYNPTTDTWSAIPPTGGIPDSLFEVAAWTGSRMIVCGLGSGAQVHCALYNPTDGTWTVAANSPNKPSPRDAMKGAWTGTVLAVYGGTTTDGNYTPLGDGAYYNPATDTWGTLTHSLVSPGNARDRHTVTFGAGRLLIWGGKTTASSSTVTDGGFRKAESDFAVPGFTVAGTANAPAARSDHTAVWTGSQCLVWGGLIWTGTSTAHTATGAGFSFATDAWTTIPTENSGTPRFRHTATWTGTEMVIFGGVGPSGYLSEPRAYNPSTRTLHIYQRP